MARTRALTVAAAALSLLLTGTAWADNGRVSSGAASSWTCWEVEFPPGADDTQISISGGSGDADLYVYARDSGTQPGWWQVEGRLCAPYQYGNEETCASEIPDSGGDYWACIKGYGAGPGYSDVMLVGTYDDSGAWATAGGAVSTATMYSVDYWKDNLFWGIAYHRIGCMVARRSNGSWVIASELDYDGFSAANYCRRGEAWDSPLQYGASAFIRTDELGTSFAAADNILKNCGDDTNYAYGTPNYAKRGATNHPNYCPYNILNDCNSDCWIREFSSCVSTAVGNGKGAIGIASPCW
jgi:hypothetical protein